MPDKTFQFKNPVKWENSFQLDTNTGMITMLRSIYLPKEINQFEIDFIVEDPTHRQFGKDAVTAKVWYFVTIIVQTYCEKKNVLVIKKNF